MRTRPQQRGEERKMQRVILITLTCATLGACTAAVGTQDESLLNAPVDTTHKFDVGVCGKGLKADGVTCAGSKCSGTLIADNVVLTARHCVDAIAYQDAFCDSQFVGPLAAAMPVVTTSDSVKSPTAKWYTVQSIAREQTAGLCSDDVVLLTLGSKVPVSEARPARVDASKDYAKHPPTSVAIVGRGIVTDTPDGTDDGGLVRRILTNIPFVCATDDPAQPCNVVDFSSPPSNMFASPPAYFVIGASTDSGDSGSGVFDQKHFDQPSRAVFGVTSAGTYAEDFTPNFGLISRIDTHKDLIRGALHQAGHDDIGVEGDE
jgi:hypothetical protein